MPLATASISAALIVARGTSQTTSVQTDILVFGSSLGGTSAAIIAAEQGANVILAMGSDVIGGQAVESGMSAFDETHQRWEAWGLYADLITYLRKHIETSDGYHGGLGLPKVGRVASIPADIATFFLSRIQKNENITLLTGHAISDLKQKKGQWYAATLTHVETGKKTTVRFRYLVDGTMTGQLLEWTNTPYRLGFDTAEETGEKYAMPKQVRDAFVEGTTIDNKTFAALGSRTQAVTSPFVLLDRGYPGEFAPAVPESCPQNDTQTGGLIAGARVLRMTDTECAARITIAPEFEDAYDLSLILHEGGSVHVSVSSPLWPQQPLIRLLTADKDGEPVFVGTFPASSTHPLTLLVTASTGQPGVEGALFVQKNLRIPPVVLSKPQAWEIPLLHYEATGTYADIYLTGSDLPRNEAPVIGGRAVPSFEATSTTIFVPRVSLRGRPALSLSSELRATLSSVVIIPTAFDLSPLRFGGDAPDREIPSEETAPSSILRNTDTTIREWRFTAQENGTTVFSIETPAARWWRAELWKETPEQLLKSMPILTQQVTRNPQPMFSAVLEKGETYRMRIGLPKGEAWQAFSWSADPVGSSSALFTDSPSKGIIVPSDHQEGIYDLWVAGTPASSVSYSVLRHGSPDVTATVQPVRYQYQYAGKAFLDRSATLHLKTEGATLLALPNPHVDTYVRSAALTGTSASLVIGTLPPGYYHMTVSGGPTTSARIGASLGTGSSVQTLSLPQTQSATGRRLVPETLVSDGKPLTMHFDPDFAMSSFHIHLFHEIPDLQDAWSFSMIHHPLMGKIEEHPIPLFLFRNIVSGTSVLRGKPAGLLPPYIGNDSHGMTLVVNPSNDFSGFRAEDIDSTEVTAGSRNLSTAYLYWMLYDSALTRPNLNCDPLGILCTTKRIRPVVGLFSDPLSLFPPKPYICEGRRMAARRTITHNDLGAEMHPCPSSGCPDQCRPTSAQKDRCLPEEQTPLLFSDALAAASYGIDLHTFVTPKEYFATLQPLATALKPHHDSASLSLVQASWKLPYSKPAQVPLSALLAAGGGNLFPASADIGTSQIANGLYRIHVNEMAIGQAVGHLLSYCLERNIAPDALTGALLRSFQHTLIERGVTIYPITDAATTRLRLPVQHLIVEGLVLPRALLQQGTYASGMSTMDYRVFPDDSADDRDTDILRTLFHTDPAKVTYRHLVFALHPELKSDTDDSVLHAAALKADIVDENHRALPAAELLAATPSKGDLYRAAYLLMHDTWVAQSDKKK